MTDHAEMTSSVSNLLTFPHGIPGFEQQTCYHLFHSETATGRVYWMEACDDPSIVFTLVDPLRYGLNYELELTDDEQTLLQVTNADDVAVFLMLWKRDPADPTENPGLNAHIEGPILINVDKHLGMQKMLIKPSVQMNIIE